MFVLADAGRERHLRLIMRRLAIARATAGTFDPPVNVADQLLSAWTDCYCTPCPAPSAARLTIKDGELMTGISSI
jgi:hypothetical protein